MVSYLRGHHLVANSSVEGVDVRDGTIGDADIGANAI
jgi:hypothetical protein